MMAWILAVKLISIFSSVVVCATEPEVYSARYAVMQFDGTTELTRHGALALSSHSASEVAAETVTRPERLIVVADVELQELFMYARMSPRRLDTGTIDVEREYLWRQSVDTTSFVFERVPSQWSGNIWTQPFRCVMADVISLKEENDITAIVKHIENTCKNGLKDNAEETILISNILLRRIPATDGRSFVVNSFRDGEAVSALHAVSSEQDGKCYHLVSQYLSHEKPVETRRGSLRLSITSALPDDIRIALANVQPKAQPNDGAKSKIKKESIQRSEVPNLVLWLLSYVLLIVVICFQVLFGGMKNDLSN
jgi:hypothetical protein